MSETPAALLRDNPFFVLDIGVEATPIEVERAAQRLLALLELGGAKSRSFETPFGSAERNADLVRQSLTALRIPQQRKMYEILTEVAPVTEREQDSLSRPWQEASRAIGWQAPWPR